MPVIKYMYSTRNLDCLKRRSTLSRSFTKHQNHGIHPSSRSCVLSQKKPQRGRGQYSTMISLCTQNPKLATKISHQLLHIHKGPLSKFRNPKNFNVFVNDDFLSSLFTSPDHPHALRRYLACIPLNTYTATFALQIPLESTTRPIPPKYVSAAQSTHSSLFPAFSSSNLPRLTT